MTNKFNYNFINRTIEGSKSSIEKANKGILPEYAELAQKLAEHPDFSVVTKVIKSNENKKTYKNLKINRMEEYIGLQDNSESKLAEFDKIKKIAKAKGALYPLCKKWFLSTYPEYKETTISFAQDVDTNDFDAMIDSMMEGLDVQEVA